MLWKGEREKYNKYFALGRDLLKAAFVVCARNRYRGNFQRQTRTKRVISSIQFSPLTLLQQPLFCKWKRRFAGCLSAAVASAGTQPCLETAAQENLFVVHFSEDVISKGLKILLASGGVNVARANMMILKHALSVSRREKQPFAKRADSKRLLSLVSDRNIVFFYIEDIRTFLKDDYLLKIVSFFNLKTFETITFYILIYKLII